MNKKFKNTKFPKIEKKFSKISFENKNYLKQKIDTKKNK